MIDGGSKNMIKEYKITFKRLKWSRNDYKIGCLLDYPYLKKYCQIVAIDLSKQKALDPDPKAIQEINFTENLDQAGNTTMTLIL